MILEKALNLFFPIKCGVCEKIGIPICKECEENLKQYEINFMFKENIKIESLGNSFINKELNFKDNIWDDKTNNNLKIQKIFIYKYQDIIRNLLINYKFYDASYLANSFAYLTVPFISVLTLFNLTAIKFSLAVSNGGFIPYSIAGIYPNFG